MFFHLSCILFPSDYFAINATPNVYATLEMVPVELPRLSELVGMNLQGRVGGVTSLGISAAKLLSSLFGGDDALAILVPIQYRLHSSIHYANHGPWHQDG